MSDITVDVGETLSVVFDFHKELEIPRRSNYQYTTTEYVTIGAYIYECTNAGKTGTETPESITTTIGVTQVDGTVEWTCRDYGANGYDAISSKTVTPSSAAITIGSSAIAKGVYVNATFTAVTAGSHSIMCEVVSAGGETLRKTQSVFIY